MPCSWSSSRWRNGVIGCRRSKLLSLRGSTSRMAARAQHAHPLGHRLQRIGDVLQVVGREHEVVARVGDATEIRGVADVLVAEAVPAMAEGAALDQRAFPNRRVAEVDAVERPHHPVDRQVAAKELARAADLEPDLTASAAWTVRCPAIGRRKARRRLRTSFQPMGLAPAVASASFDASIMLNARACASTSAAAARRRRAAAPRSPGTASSRSPRRSAPPWAASRARPRCRSSGSSACCA